VFREEQKNDEDSLFPISQSPLRLSEFSFLSSLDRVVLSSKNTRSFSMPSDFTTSAD